MLIPLFMYKFDIEKREWLKNRDFLRNKILSSHPFLMILYYYLLVLVFKTRTSLPL